MAVGASSYGSAPGVASLSLTWTNAGAFDTTTRPTLAQVESFIDQISAMVNVALAKEGFSTPLTNSQAVLAVKSIVEQLASDMVQAANSSGRFFTDRALAAGLSPLAQIRKEISDWVSDQAAGLEAIGASRTVTTSVDSIGYRSTDQSGDEVSPIFQRKGFGNVFDDWDSD